MKYCNKCKLGIDRDKEHIKVIHYKDKKKEFNKLYYHIECYSELMKEALNIQQLLKKSNYLAKRAFEMLGEENKEHYEVK